MKTFLIRLRENNKLRWAYIKTNGGFRDALARARELFGEKLIGFEPGRVKNLRKEYEIYK